MKSLNHLQILSKASAVFPSSNHLQQASLNLWPTLKEKLNLLPKDGEEDFENFDVFKSLAESGEEELTDFDEHNCGKILNFTLALQRWGIVPQMTEYSVTFLPTTRFSLSSETWTSALASSSGGLLTQIQKR